MQAAGAARSVYPGPKGPAAPAQAAAAALPPPATPAASGQLAPAATPAVVDLGTQPHTATGASAPLQPAFTPAAAADPGIPAAPDDSRPDGAAADAGDGRRLDINTASVDELNRLGGRFGKAIVAGRPYASIDELVSKRVLTRATFGQIRDQITAN